MAANAPTTYEELMAYAPKPVDQEMIPGLSGEQRTIAKDIPGLGKVYFSINPNTGQYNDVSGDAAAGQLNKFVPNADGSIGKLTGQQDSNSIGALFHQLLPIAGPFLAAVGGGMLGAEGFGLYGAAGTAGADAAGWVSAEGGAGYAGGMAADAGALSSATLPQYASAGGTTDAPVQWDAPTDQIGSDWATGQATTDAAGNLVQPGGLLPTDSATGLTLANTAAQGAGLGSVNAVNGVPSGVDKVGSDWATGQATKDAAGNLVQPGGLLATNAMGNTAANTAAGVAGAAGAGGAAAGGAGAAAPGAAGAGAAGGLAGAAGTAAALTGAVTGINAIAGDPLGLNKGADDANKAAADAANASADAQKTLAQIAQDQWNYYKTNYQPLETNLIKQASEAGSPEEFARARGAANADVTGAFDTANKNTQRQMQSYGINPGSPAYQSGVGSANLAQGAATAGALTQADRNTRNLAYSKALDVVGIGRNIPAQSAASAANAANAATNASNVANQRQVTQNQQGIQNTQALGYGLNTIGNLASKWFGTPTTTNYTGAQQPAGYAEGGAVIDAERTGPGQYDATALKTTMMRHGLSPTVAHAQAHGAAKRVFTPHMRVFAQGGGVGDQGLGPDESNMGMPNDVSNTSQPVNGVGTETSDSIPATIDGQEPAALSDGEFVVNAEVPKMTGEEILTAINQAGLQKRQQAGIQPKTSNDVPINSGAQAYARGGRVNRFACAGLGR